MLHGLAAELSREPPGRPRRRVPRRRGRGPSARRRDRAEGPGRDRPRRRPGARAPLPERPRSGGSPLLVPAAGRAPRSTDRGSPVARRLPEHDALGLGVDPRRGGRDGAVEAPPDRDLGRRRGLERRVPEDGRERRPAETEGEGAPRVSRDRGGPFVAADAGRRRGARCRRFARRAAGATATSGGTTTRCRSHQPGRAGIDLRVARAADRHGSAPAHLARRRSRTAARFHPHARGWNVR